MPSAPQAGRKKPPRNPRHRHRRHNLALRVPVREDLGARSVPMENLRANAAAGGPADRADQKAKDVFLEGLGVTNVDLARI